MTLLTFILSLALSFVCSSYEECENIRSIEYIYEAAEADNTATSSDAPSGIDYQITERITFANEGGTDIVETVYSFPYLDDRNVHDWQMAVNLLALERGVSIKEFKDNVAVGYVPEGMLEAYKDIYHDGYANDIESLDYLDERELSEQRTRYTIIYVSFSIFLMSAKMIRSCLFTFIKGKGVN